MDEQKRIQEIKTEVISEARKVEKALGRIFDLVTYESNPDNDRIDLGCGDWFCKEYPFGQDLFEFLGALNTWISDLEENK